MDKLSSTIKKIRGIDKQIMQQAQKRLDDLTKPQGSLGRLEELARQIAGITARLDPPMERKVIFTLAGDHGVTEEGVSAFPKEVTLQMVHNFLGGGAAINVLARHVDSRVIVADMGVAGEIGQGSKVKGQRCMDKKIALGTKNFTKGPAMSRAEAIRCVEAGIELFEEENKNGIDIVGTGEMGIGNTTAASAVAAVFTAQPLEKLVGRGTGVGDEALENKIRVIKKALEFNRPDSADPLDVLSKVGGFEIGGLCGIILAAAAARVPVVIDGFISTAAALIAWHLESKAKDYMIAAHCSVEPGHRLMLEHIGLKPFLDLDMRLGEGTGAALGISIAEASIKILKEMSTFQSASVSNRSG